MKRSTTLALGAVLAATLFAGCGDDSKSAGGTDATYCERIKAYKAKADELDSVFDTATPDSAKIEEAFTTMQSMLHDLQEGAPAAIKADVAAQIAGVDGVVEIFSKYDWDLTALAAAPEFAQLQEDLSGDDMQASSDRLREYSEKTCGIVDTSDTTSSDTTAP